MNTPPPGRTSAPLRAAGVALLGLAVALAAVGVLTRDGGNAVNATAAGASTTAEQSARTSIPTTSPATTASTTLAAPATTTPAPTTPPAPTTTPAPTTPTPPAPSPAATTTTAPAAISVPTSSPTDPATAIPPASPDPPPDLRRSVDVTVLNNSTVTGLGARAAARVRAAGWTVTRVGNFTGRIPTTTVYYRPGTNEEAPARLLASDVGARVEPRFDGLPRSAAGVVLVVTSDFRG